MYLNTKPKLKYLFFFSSWGNWDFFPFLAHPRSPLPSTALRAADKEVIFCGAQEEIPSRGKRKYKQNEDALLLAPCLSFCTALKFSCTFPTASLHSSLQHRYLLTLAESSQTPKQVPTTRAHLAWPLPSIACCYPVFALLPCLPHSWEASNRF